MSNNWSEDKPKVMDVNHPGKGKIITASSRPVASPVVGGNAYDESVKYDYSHRKTIVPISDDLKNNDKDKKQHAKLHHNKKQPSWREESDEVESNESEETKDNSESTYSVDEKTEDVGEYQETAKPKYDESDTVHETESDIDSKTNSDTNQSGNAEVDELASAVVEKREAKQKAMQEASERAELDAMISSKEYFVPISTEQSNRKVIAVIAVMAVIVVISIVAFFWMS